MLILDTHVWLWLADGARTFSPAAQSAIREALAQNALFLSPISMWEVALKASRGKLELSQPAPAWMHRALDFPGLHLAPITVEIACECAELPAAFHGDPADRIIAATARSERLTLLTQDRTLLQLAKRGYLTAMPI